MTQKRANPWRRGRLRKQWRKGCAEGVFVSLGLKQNKKHRSFMFTCVYLSIQMCLCVYDVYTTYICTHTHTQDHASCMSMCTCMPKNIGAGALGLASLASGAEAEAAGGCKGQPVPGCIV